MAKQEFKNVAPWTKEEKFIFPILALLGVAGILVGLGVIPLEGMQSTGWTVGVPLTAVGLLALWTSYSRKRKSTIHTTVKGSKVHVWMTKPSKVRWDDRLSEGNNVADLSTLNLVSFEDVNGTEVLRLHTNDGLVIVPWRVIGSDTEAGKAIKGAIAAELNSGRKISFQDEATEKSVRGWVDGAPLVFVAPKKAKRPDYNKVGSSSKPATTAPAKSPEGGVGAAAPAPAAPVKPAKPVRHIGYQKFAQEAALDAETSVAVAVSSGIASLESEEARKMEEEDALPGYAGNLLLGDSITINLDDKK